ncbi:MAG: hypothetical protein M1826_006138 [Phylliscum demangeonii]|nr:MAG: hypothetical protein M1826_006138 [Phylliscum demangeonii]
MANSASTTATDASGFINDGPFVVLPPIPSSCFSPVATVSSFGTSTETDFVLPSNTECVPWRYTGKLLDAYSTRGTCPSGWLHDDAWPDSLRSYGSATCCPTGFTPGYGATTLVTTTGTTTATVGSSSVFSTDFTATIRSTIQAGSCYSHMTGSNVLKRVDGTTITGDPITVISPVLVTMSEIITISVSTTGGVPSTTAPAPTPAKPSPAAAPTPKSSSARSSSAAATGAAAANPSAFPSGSAASGTTTALAGGAGNSTSSGPVLRQAQSVLTSTAKIALSIAIPVVLIALIVGLLLCCLRRKQTKKRNALQLQQRLAPPPHYHQPAFAELETQPAQQMLDSVMKTELPADGYYPPPQHPPASHQPQAYYASQQAQYAQHHGGQPGGYGTHPHQWNELEAKSSWGPAAVETKSAF